MISHPRVSFGMSFQQKLLVGVLALAATVSLSAQTITSAGANYDAADGLIEWSFILDEQTATDTITHMVLGFTDGAGVPDVFWDFLSNVTINSNTFHATKLDVWTDGGSGTSYLEANFNSPIVLGGSSATHNFSFLTGGTNGLGNTTSFFISLYSGGPATQNMTLDGSLVATISGFGVGTADLTAVPEPSTYALLAGLAMMGFVALRRRG